MNKAKNLSLKEQANLWIKNLKDAMEDYDDPNDQSIIFFKGKIDGIQETLAVAEAELEKRDKEIQKLKELLMETLRQAKDYEDKMEGQVAAAQQILNEFPDKFPINPNKKGDWELWHFENLKEIIGRLRAALPQKEQKTDSEEGKSLLHVRRLT